MLRPDLERRPVDHLRDPRCDWPCRAAGCGPPRTRFSPAVSMTALADAGFTSGTLLGASASTRFSDQEPHPLARRASPASASPTSCLGGLPGRQVGLHQPAQQRVARPGRVGEPAVPLGRGDVEVPTADPAQSRRRGRPSRRPARARVPGQRDGELRGRRVGREPAHRAERGVDQQRVQRRGLVGQLRPSVRGDRRGHRRPVIAAPASAGSDDLALEDLAGRALGQRVDEPHLGAGTCTRRPAP